jgi:hypothetical protein
MLPQALACTLRRSVLVWTLGEPGLLDVHVHIFREGEEIPGSPFACDEHPTLPGSYLAELTFTAADTYLLNWAGGDEAFTAAQNLIVVAQLTATPRIHAKLIDVGDRLPIAGVTAVFSHLDPDTGDYVVDATAVSDDEGYVAADLAWGVQYVLSLFLDGTVFSSNNWFFEVEANQLTMPLLVTTGRVAIPWTGPVAPTDLVTMSVVLLGPTGQPLRYRNLSLTTTRPVTYDKGADFIVAEDTVVVHTDANGQAAVTLIPGTEIEVAVEGSRLIRRFVVPAADFNLSAYVGGDNDYFNVVELPYAAAETP